MTFRDQNVDSPNLKRRDVYLISDSKHPWGAGRTTDLLNRTDDLALIRCETCGPEVDIFEDIVDNGWKEKQNQTKKHHEDTALFQANFIKNVQNLYNKITCNPFKKSMFLSFTLMP